MNDYPLMFVTPLCFTWGKVSGQAVWWARCVRVICKTNRQKLEQIIRYWSQSRSRVSPDQCLREPEPVTILLLGNKWPIFQLTTGRSRSQSVHNLPSISECLQNKSCKDFLSWLVWVFLLVKSYNIQPFHCFLTFEFVVNSVWFLWDESDGKLIYKFSLH